MALTRARLLRAGLATAGGAALAGTPLALGADEEDLAFVRLGIATELLGGAYYARATRPGRFARPEREALLRAQAHERRHYEGLAAIIGPTASTGNDFDFRFPQASFATRRSAVLLGARLETIFAGVYLGAVAELKDVELRSLAARIAACQAAHLGLLRALATPPATWIAFPRPLDVVDASAALEPFGA